jgi:hypothetical protein
MSGLVMTWIDALNNSKSYYFIMLIGTEVLRSHTTCTCILGFDPEAKTTQLPFWVATQLPDCIFTYSTGHTVLLFSGQLSAPQVV